MSLSVKPAAVRSTAWNPGGRHAEAPATARRSGRGAAHRGIAAFTALSLLAGCGGVSTREGRIGADDGDVCRPQVVALDSTGNFFAEDILKGAAVGALGGAALGGLIGGNWRGAAIGAAAGAAAGAAGGYLYALQQRNSDQAALNASLAGDLERENAELDRTQLAFNQLMDCRFNRAQQIRTAVASGQMDRATGQAQMADLRQRTQRDIALAQQINQQIGTRGAEFDTAIDTVSPGARSEVVAARSAPARPAQVSRATPLRLRPDSSAPQVGTVTAREAVQVKPAAGGYALVETASGARGYVPDDAVGGATASRGRRSAATPAGTAAAGSVPPAASGDVRSLAASNVARRDNFNDSVAQAQTAAAQGGFELAG
ncbi:SH3 domain-containing protein [Roseomonas sp. OT10]|uniref:YMGG-like glycine zipper-containing protein n=1 Tax=Roseomonas cutis TaxID=2897332 RepID=UPI001E62B6FE|nr:SH3 domain-containing protein [Roseomonas sp. OT10]UFN47777.1 SH3 domain-containing protein [Roseomonas sp. OT10]